MHDMVGPMTMGRAQGSAAQRVPLGMPMASGEMKKHHDMMHGHMQMMLELMLQTQTVASSPRRNSDRSADHASLLPLAIAPAIASQVASKALRVNPAPEGNQSPALPPASV
jgi:hypothetical protein